MKVTDASGRRWLIARRFAPWRRVVRPWDLFFGAYQPYRATPVGPPARQRAARRAESRRLAERRSGIVDNLVNAVDVIVSLPGLIFVSLVCVALLPVALLESLFCGVAGAVLWPLRRTGLMRSRIDVVASYPKLPGFPSVTVITVPSPAHADALVRGLAKLLDQATGPFDPQNDPFALRLLAESSALIPRHTSYLVRG